MTANPVELIGGITTTASVPKADVVAWAKARVRQTVGDAAEIRNTDFNGQTGGVFNSDTGTEFYLDTADTTTADDGVSCIIDLVGNRFKHIAGDVPLPTSVSLGGVFSSVAVSNQFVTGIHTDGSLLRAQPSAANLSNGVLGGSGTVILSGALDTDGTLAANSDSKIATQKATKTYVDGIVAANDAMVFKGVLDCSTNPNYPAADRGHVYRVSVAGKIGGASGTNVEAGDILLCLTDSTASGNQATVGSSWSVIQVDIDGAVTLTGSQTLTDKTLIAPVLGAATATSINKVAITAPLTSATLTIADGKTLTASNTLTFTGTDGSSVAFGAGGTISAVGYSGSASDLGTGTLPNARLVSVPNSALANSSVTIGSTAISLGASSATLAGLTSVTSTTFVGALTGNASTASAVAASALTGATLAAGVTASSLTSVGTIATGVWNGTAIANANLANSAVTIGSTSVSLGATAATIAGLTLTAPVLGAATGTSLVLSGTTDQSGASTGTFQNPGGSYFGKSLYIASSTPASTTYALYNVAGNLYFNGVALATGSSVSGTPGALSYFTGASTLGDSIVSQSVSVISVAGALSALYTDGFYLGDRRAFKSSAPTAGYLQLYDGSANNSLSLGPASDPTNYYSNTAHVFSNRAGSTTYGKFNPSGGFSIGTTTDAGAGGLTTTGTNKFAVFTTPGTLGNKADGIVISGGYVTPQMYGAAGNGTTDDTTALSDCLNSGNPVHLVGKFKITSAITVTLDNGTGPYGLFVQGMGAVASQILLTTTASTITINVEYSGKDYDTNTPVVLKDFGLKPTVAAVGSSTVGALNVIGTPNIGSTTSNVHIDNLTVVGATANTHYAYVPIFLKDVRNLTVTRCNLLGNAHGTASTSGIVFTSSDNGATGNAPVDFNVRDNHITSFQYGIELRASGNVNHAYSNDWQGAHISGNTILDCDYCVYANSTDVNANGFQCSDNNMSAYLYCLYLNNLQGFQVNGNIMVASANACTFLYAATAASAYCLGTCIGNYVYAAGYASMTATNTSGTYMNFISANNHKIVNGLYATF